MDRNTIFALVATVISVIAIKIGARAATQTKAFFDAHNAPDPVVNFFAWIDRHTGFRPR